MQLNQTAIRLLSGVLGAVAVPLLLGFFMPPAPAEGGETSHVEVVRDTSTRIQKLVSPEGRDSLTTISFLFENDMFTPVKHDRHYTQGGRLSLITGEDRVWGIVRTTARVLPFFPADGSLRAGYSLGQKIYTPANTLLVMPIASDRPYAGWLYGALSIVGYNGRTQDVFEASLGVVGPASLAEPTQRIFHAILDGRDPKGWSNQLGNEITLSISRERKWRNIVAGGGGPLQFEISPHVSGSLGNAFVYGAGGATLRIGNDLTSDYGAPRIRPSLSGSEFFRPAKSLGWYLFGGGEARAVARNIFLDGNTFIHSMSVDSNPWVFDFQVGTAVTRPSWRLGFTYVFRSFEFTRQYGWNHFGVFSYAIRL